MSVRNPFTGRQVKIGGATHRKLGWQQFGGVSQEAEAQFDEGMPDEYQPQGTRLYVIYHAYAEDSSEVGVATSWARARAYAQHLLDMEIEDKGEELDGGQFIIRPQPGAVGEPVPLLTINGEVLFKAVTKESV